MEQSPVYFSNLRASVKENLLEKLARLMDTGGIHEVIRPGSLTAVKLHFGEKGNTAFIRPLFIRQIVDKIKALEGRPFLTDTNTLYAGSRGNSVSHMHTAVENGFSYAVVNAPIIIADGLRGASSIDVHIEGEIVKTAHVSKEIYEADFLFSVAHFKGHELSGFGGAIKNTGMGCASRKGKLQQHSDLSPRVSGKKCEVCGECVSHCAQEAITLEKNKAVIDPEKCVGCGECILVCPNSAINVQWNTDIPRFLKKMAEYTAAVLKDKPGKSMFMNFLTDISPACDCHGHNDAPIAGDIGVLLSRDPVAIDQASVDLVNKQVTLEGSCLQGSGSPVEDKFGALYPRVHWPVQLEYGEQLGLGSRDYKLITI